MNAWSKYYACCVRCGTTENKHNARGFCGDCYKQVVKKSVNTTEYNKKYYAANREKLNLKSRNYYLEHKTELLLYNKIYLEKNKEKRAGYNKKYSYANRKKLAAYAKKYRLEHPDYHKQYYAKNRRLKK